jgi:hypothetical protein
MLMGNRDVTICLTSCGRWDLLEKTISSLVTYWDGEPPAAFYINDDSGEINQKLMGELDRFLMRHWQIMADWTFTNREGQPQAIDKTYQLVQTKYIFHCEDDWEFYNSGFIGDSRSVLETEPKCACVWIRHPNDRHGHTVLPIMKLTKKRVRYQQLAHRYKGDWHGFTWNPGLRRLSDYLAMGKFSDMCEWRSDDHYHSEKQFNRKYYEAGYVAMTLCRGFVKHIGHLDSTKNRVI